MRAREFIVLFANLVAEETGFSAPFRQGFPKPLALAARNPGLLTHWKGRDGQPLETNSGVVVFPTVEGGWNALREKIRSGVIERGYSSQQFFNGLWTRPVFNELGQMLHDEVTGRVVLVDGRRDIPSPPDARQAAVRVAQRVSVALGAPVDRYTSIARLLEAGGQNSGHRSGDSRRGQIAQGRRSR